MPIMVCSTSVKFIFIYTLSLLTLIWALATLFWFSLIYCFKLETRPSRGSTRWITCFPVTSYSIQAQKSSSRYFVQWPQHSSRPAIETIRSLTSWSIACISQNSPHANGIGENGPKLVSHRTVEPAVLTLLELYLVSTIASMTHFSPFDPAVPP